MPKQSDWRRNFRQDIGRKLEESKKEFELYRKTGYIIYLQQAGNKLFSAVENHLMLKHDYRARSYGDLYEKVKSNNYDRSLLKSAFHLHRFFYNGDLQMPVYQAEDEFIRLSAIMDSRLRRLH